MKIGKLVWDKEDGVARVVFSKKFHFDLYGYEQLDVIEDIQKQLEGWKKSIAYDEAMEDVEIAAREDELAQIG